MTQPTTGEGHFQAASHRSWVLPLREQAVSPIAGVTPPFQRPGAPGTTDVGSVKGGPRGAEIGRFIIRDMRVVPKDLSAVFEFDARPSMAATVKMNQLGPSRTADGSYDFVGRYDRNWRGPYNPSSYRVSGQGGRYRLDTATGARLDGPGELLPGVRYHFIVSVPTGDSDPPDQFLGTFITGKTTVTVVFTSVYVGDDSDDLSDGDMYFGFSFEARGGQPRKYKDLGARTNPISIGSGQRHNIREELTIDHLTGAFSLQVDGCDEDDVNLGGILSSLHHSLSVFVDTGETRGCDCNRAKAEFDVSRYPGSSVSIPFTVRSPGGKMTFEARGYFTIQRVEGSATLN
jgi:hypothetical protein